MYKVNGFRPVSCTGCKITFYYKDGSYYERPEEDTLVNVAAFIEGHPEKFMCESCCKKIVENLNAYRKKGLWAWLKKFLFIGGQLR